jgi:hypothetical protein
MSTDIVKAGEVTLGSKVMWSSISALLFVVLSSPYVYSLTARVLPTSVNGCPTTVGLFLHAAVFMLVKFLIMKFASSEKLTTELMLKYAFYGTLLFLVLAGTDAYRLTGLASNGCPELKGLLLHGVVYMVLLVAMMSFPKDQ